MIRTGYGYGRSGGPIGFPIQSRSFPPQWTRPVVVIDRASAYAALREVAKMVHALERMDGAYGYAGQAIRISARSAMRAAGAYVREDAS